MSNVLHGKRVREDESKEKKEMESELGFSSRIVRERAALDVAIVGAGVGGLVTAYLLGRAGHRVTVYDGASELATIGAGIQVSPNVTRLMIRWGLGEKLQELGVVPTGISLRRYANGDVIGWKNWGDNMEKDHGAPYYVIHRGDLHSILLEHARPYMKLRLNSMVMNVDPHAPSITLQSGEVVKTHLIVGADGINSRVRSVVFGNERGPTLTGDASYRALVPTSVMMNDPDLKGLLNGGSNIWMGPGRHLVAYPIRGHKLFNVVTAHPSKSTDKNSRSVDPDAMRKDFAAFEPRIQKLLSLISFTTLWPLMDCQPLEKWVHNAGSVCLLGDACHPMLPYRAQGAAMAIEDAAVLGNLLSRITNRGQLGLLLLAYQSIRYPRATTAQAESRMNQRTFHLPDGPEQKKRDDSMRQAKEAALKEANGEFVGDNHVGNENLWADKERNERTFSHDVDVEVARWWSEHGQDIVNSGSKL
ncbi:hypothetical protein CPB84DRAFT_1776847 [Gymnopilus junonius]|uniref:FAD-binding domain-containing protein n=1 Tax=Gymnopilus junonius TaxID=109634 RepID=A0A9P5TNY7_GYMJU|nr:hypothetical protein CPB84DRAFT_1776847 [Gymnopilus junonius]